MGIISFLIGCIADQLEQARINRTIKKFMKMPVIWRLDKQDYQLLYEKFGVEMSHPADKIMVTFCGEITDASRKENPEEGVLAVIKKHYEALLPLGSPFFEQLNAHTEIPTHVPKYDVGANMIGKYYLLRLTREFTPKQIVKMARYKRLPYLDLDIADCMHVDYPIDFEIDRILAEHVGKEPKEIFVHIKKHLSEKRCAGMSFKNFPPEIFALLIGRDVEDVLN